MPSTDAESPDESFFNDLSQQVPDLNGGQQSPERSNSQDGQREDGSNKPKRIACVLCRKRKLRCDGTRPTCGTCKRLAHDCAYDEVRKKSGPKRGYVKLLEARLQQVETLLKNQESAEQNKENSQQDPASVYVASTLQQGLPNANNFSEGRSPGQEPLQTNGSANAHAADSDFPWEMIGLGLDEPLPPQDVMNDLNQLYFTKIHPSVPVIHKPRFLAAMNLAPHMRPPICLRYIMWTMAASVTEKYDALQEHFYQRARKYAQMDEMKGHGEGTITLAHCQAWILLGTYEFKQMYFPRAWMSTGRAVRLAQMMQLHRLDGVGLDVKQCLAPPKDWTEREERRRTFWMTFCIDRYASIGTGWPMTIEEQDILTNLPAREEAFEKSKAMATTSLTQALQPNGASRLEPFGGIVVTAALFGRNLLHLHRPGPDDRDDDVNGGFWTRHRNIESILLNTSLSLPDGLRLPSGLPDPNVVFLNMAIHTSSICLHQAAIFKADKYRLPITVSNESKVRCVTAAAEIASAMRMISHMDLSAMNPFISFCVYVAARVFVQYLKTRPNDQNMNSSLQFLLQAMQALRRKNPLTESFLVQLDLDLEVAGVKGTHRPAVATSSSNPSMAELSKNMEHFDPAQRAYNQRNYDINESQGCIAIFEIRETADVPSTAVTNAHLDARPHPQFVDDSPGLPFQHATASVNLELDPITPFVPSQPAQQMNLPARDRQSAFSIPDNEMDVTLDDQASPATTNSNSRGGSTSHTSYSPAGQNDMNNMPHYRSSPKNNAISSNGQMPMTNTSTASPQNFFPTQDDMFYNAPMANDPMSMYLGTNDWDMTAIGAGPTGMAPMSEGNWNQMLESINLGWDSMGPPHGRGNNG